MFKRTKDALRQIYPDRKATWGGAGFVRLYEGGGLEFTVTSKHIQISANYEIAIRYEQVLIKEVYFSKRFCFHKIYYF